MVLPYTAPQQHEAISKPSSRQTIKQTFYSSENSVSSNLNKEYSRGREQVEMIHKTLIICAAKAILFVFCHQGFHMSYMVFWKSG